MGQCPRWLLRRSSSWAPSVVSVEVPVAVMAEEAKLPSPPGCSDARSSRVLGTWTDPPPSHATRPLVPIFPVSEFFRLVRKVNEQHSQVPTPREKKETSGPERAGRPVPRCTLETRSLRRHLKLNDGLRCPSLSPAQFHPRTSPTVSLHDDDTTTARSREPEATC